MQGIAALYSMDLSCRASIFELNVTEYESFAAASPTMSCHVASGNASLKPTYDKLRLRTKRPCTDMLVRQRLDVQLRFMRPNHFRQVTL